MVNMNTVQLTEELLRELTRLSPEMQQLVLDFARRLASFPQEGVSGNDLIRFAGILSPDEAGEIERAIEEGCEQVDPSESIEGLKLEKW
ncbi:MAG TPA: hypothetical protein GXX39_08890 [Syntrophothermus lipocalidus]|nr:hypothetical protein [Syntrophothermus sp.]HHV77471.1 hypothetical protein [Syntrophothermus lipocalidus]